MKQPNRKFYFCAHVILAIVSMLPIVACAQLNQIVGPTTGYASGNTMAYHYTYPEGQLWILPQWNVGTQGTVMSTSVSPDGATSTALIKWTTTGSSTIQVKDNHITIGTLNVTVAACATVATPTSLSTVGLPVCKGTSVSFSGTPATGTVLWWYDANPGGNLIGTGNTNFVITQTSTYYAASHDNTTTCNSSLVAAPTVTALAIPEGPSIAAPVPLPAPSTMNLTSVPPSGSSVKWYNVFTGGSSVASGSTYMTPSLTQTTSYFLTSYDGTSHCESWPRTEVVVEMLHLVAPGWVKTESVRTEGVFTDNQVYGLTSSQKNVGFTYLDGMMRVNQQVAKAMSPAGHDIVQPVQYDAYGRTSRDYLPYVSTSATDGSFKTSFVTEQAAFYQASGDKIANDAKPFDSVRYETSPLGRPLEQGGVGLDWQPGSTHTSKAEYSFNSSANTSDSVRMFASDGTSSGFYANNMLSRVKTTDSNGNLEIVFTDAAGRTVARKKQLDEVIGSTTVNWLTTYFVYDDLGHIKYVIPPKAANKLRNNGWSLDAPTLDQYVFQFVYDNRGRVVEKKVPGQAWQYITYDPLGRLALMQDGFLRATNQWIFIKYDQKNRAVMQGLYTNATQTTRAAVQTLLDGLYVSGNATYGVNAWYETRGTTLQGYTNLSFPKLNADGSAIALQTVNYFDTYDFDFNGTTDYKYDSTQAPTTTSMRYLYGMPTGSKRLILGTSSWLINYVFYDKFGRTIQSRYNNHLSLTADNLTTLIYDFEGKVLTKKTYHNAGGAHQTTVLNTYTYDTGSRLINIAQKNNTDAQVTLAQYNYNELGQMVEKNLHYTGSAYLQSIDLRYNIKGWLTSINNAQLTNDSGSTNDDTNDYFGMELVYNTSESGSMGNTLRYDGSISAVKWKGMGQTSGAADQRSFKYAYDKSDKLKSATYQAYGTSAWNKDTGLYNEAMNYDHNGNILGLQRYQNLDSLNGVSVLSKAILIDNLTYTYALGNRLSKVEDASSNMSGFANGANIPIEYKYDTTGNVILDKNKGIDTVKYNYLGKPDRIKYTDGRINIYTYDAGGSKLTLKTYSTTGTLLTTTDYVGGFVYDNNTLSFFSSPEGRVVNNGGTLEYQYSITDQQGNTRVVFSSVTPAATPLTATFEGDANDNSSQYTNVSNVVSFVAANHTSGGTKVVRLNQSYKVGPSKSLKVYPGDKVDMNVWTYFENNSGYGTSDFTASTMITAIAGAFGGVSGAGGESGNIFSGVNSALGAYGLGGNAGDTSPAAYINYILFDQDYKVMNMGFTRVPTSAYFSKQQISIPQVTVAEAGYIFVYLSYEDQSNNWVEFDDLSITQTKNNVVQYNEYYPFGLQAQRSWTRENSKNNFLGNGGSEMNSSSGWYDTFYRGYDPALGRFHQVDPKATMTADFTPYHYAANNPVMFNDPGGDKIQMPPDWDPGFHASPGGSDPTMYRDMIFGAMAAADSWYQDIRPGYQGGPNGMGSMQMAVANGEMSADQSAQYAASFGKTLTGQAAINAVYGEGYMVVENPVLVAAVQNAQARGMSDAEIMLTITSAEQNFNTTASQGGPENWKDINDNFHNSFSDFKILEQMTGATRDMIMDRVQGLKDTFLYPEKNRKYNPNPLPYTLRPIYFTLRGPGITGEETQNIVDPKDWFLSGDPKWGNPGSIGPGPTQTGIPTPMTIPAGTGGSFYLTIYFQRNYPQ